MTTEPKTVLIVDDEPEVCLLVGDELSVCGLECHSVSDAEEARGLLEREKYDLLITEVSMPRVSGLDLLAFVRSHRAECKVILTTGLSTQECLAQALILGAYDYLEKPFNMAELIETVLGATSGQAEMPQLPMRAAAALQLVKQTKQAALESVRALVRTVEAKDPYTRRHSEHVAYYAMNLAAALGAPQQIRETVHVSALLHDIGKIGVPDHILTKPGKLTDDEFEYIRRHPTLGADILANITLFGPEAMVVRHHHEKWDGSGYPHGLVGEEIPWAARVINVADSIDAMLMDRAYKTAYPVDRLMLELQICAETQFDPEIAVAALSWCRQNTQQLILPSRPIEALSSASTTSAISSKIPSDPGSRGH